jgi:ATP-dependent Lon protease
MNPVLYFDELDKVSETTRGQEIINILVHLTDPSQNDTFYDKYFGDVPMDLSKCLIIFTYNDDTEINPILKDRMIRIETERYTEFDKVEIATRFMIPELKSQFNLEKDDVIFTQDVVKYILSKTPKESGVRNLKRSIELIMSNINLARILKTGSTTYDGVIGKCFPVNKETNSIIPAIVNQTIVDFYIKDTTCNESISHLYL